MSRSGTRRIVTGSGVILGLCFVFGLAKLDADAEPSVGGRILSIRLLVDSVAIDLSTLQFIHTRIASASAL